MSRKKEEEKIEWIIRGLLKLPENRRCINCNSLGPQYVCTTFWTFVCTNCSGIHREFTHRVKSVSMAKFNAEEVSALQAGGNERAREIYFKAWDPHRCSYPDGGNLHRLRNFIKHVYVDRRFTGERGSDRLAMVKLGAKDNLHERRSFDRSSLSSREDFYERNSFERSSPSGKLDDRTYRNHIDDRGSPSKLMENGRSGSRRSRSSARFEIVDDRFRDDECGSGRRSESRRFSSMSPEPQKIREKASPPVLCPLRDILDANSSTLKVGDLPKANNMKNAEGYGRVQKTTSSSSPLPVAAKADENKTVKTDENKIVKADENKTMKADDNKTLWESSLIDVNSDPEPTDSAAKANTQTASSIQSSTVENAPNPSNMNSLEFLLSELSFVPVGVSEVPSSSDASSTIPGASYDGVAISANSLPITTSAAPTSETAAVPSPVGNADAAVVLPSSGADSISQVPEEKQDHTLQQCQPSESPARDNNPTVHESTSTAQDNNSTGQECTSTAQDNDSTGQESTSTARSNNLTGQESTSTLEALCNQPWPSSPAPSTQEAPPNASTEQSSQAVSAASQINSSGDGSKSSGRKELPADLFTFSYPSYPAPVQNWQFRSPHGMGYGMQYPPAMHAPAFPSSEKSKNPFDFGDDFPQVPAARFPSMPSFQGTLPQMSPHGGLQHLSSAFASALPFQSPPYGMNMSPVSGAYMGQQLPNNNPNPRPQGNGSSGIGDDGDAAFASLNPIRRTSANYSAPTASNSFSSSGGNPFE